MKPFNLTVTSLNEIICFLFWWKVQIFNLFQFQELFNQEIDWRGSEKLRNLEHVSSWNGFRVLFEWSLKWSVIERAPVFNVDQLFVEKHFSDLQLIIIIKLDFYELIWVMFDLIKKNWNKSNLMNFDVKYKNAKSILKNYETLRSWRFYFLNRLFCLIILFHGKWRFIVFLFFRVDFYAQTATLIILWANTHFILRLQKRLNFLRLLIFEWWRTRSTK